MAETPLIVVSIAILALAVACGLAIGIVTETTRALLAAVVRLISRRAGR